MSGKQVFADEDERKFDQALELRDSGNLEGAKSALELLARTCAESPALHIVLGKVCWDLGDLETALVHLRRAVKIAPNEEMASLGLFHCLWEAERVAEAIGEARRFLSASDSEDYRTILADLGEEVPTKTQSARAS